MPILNWLTRDEDVKAAGAVPYRLLEEVPKFGHGESDTGNMLIQGDNLDALKALLPFYAGQVKCIFIDPPYNTSSAFSHYDDNLEHTQWLSMMWPRLEFLRELLTEDGSIWVTLDDHEAHYAKILLDELFGRPNFVANVVWQNKSAPQSNATWISEVHDHVLVYAKDKTQFRPNKLPRTEKQNAIYKHSDEYDGIDDKGKWYGRGPWYPDNFTLSLASGQRGKQYARTGKSDNIYPIITPSGREVWPAKGRAWSYIKSSYEDLLRDNRLHFGVSGNNKPTIKRFLSEVQDRGVVPMTVWHYSEVGENRIAAQEAKKFNSEDIFSTPKPERLLERVLRIGSNEGDIVLDSFLGSGTTAAVAQKIGRRFIGIELGQHAETHCAPRLNEVINGEQGGISKAVEWMGGGGFRFYRLGAPVFDEDGNICRDIKFPVLAAHIWFSETETPIGGEASTPFLGIHDGRAYALLYNGILGEKSINGGNVLNRIILKVIRDGILKTHPDFDGPLTVYGERSAVGDASLARENIEFKQTPYDVKARR